MHKTDSLILRMKLDFIRRQTIKDEVKPWRKAQKEKVERYADRLNNDAFWEAAYESYRSTRDW